MQCRHFNGSIEIYEYIMNLVTPTPTAGQTRQNKARSLFVRVCMVARCWFVGKQADDTLTLKCTHVDIWTISLTQKYTHAHRKISKHALSISV